MVKLSETKRKQTTIRQKKKTLKCKNINLCSNFHENVKNTFNNFHSLEFQSGTPRYISKNTGNGYVLLINHKKQKQDVQTVLKFAKFKNKKNLPDNLLYEYYVGMKLNELNSFYPCLIETYGLYEFNSYDSLRLFEKELPKHMNKHLKVVDTKINNMESFKTIIKLSCEEKLGLYAIMMQHFSKSNSLKSISNKNVNSLELLKCLIQIYYFLHLNSKTFTHYDLHSDNVLITKAPNNKYFHFTYHFDNGETIEFFSQYLAKIIDYGRCYYEDQSKFFYSLCEERKCQLFPKLHYFQNKNKNQNAGSLEINTSKFQDLDCGMNHGYHWFEILDPRYTFAHINSLYPNPSHDLRLYRNLRKKSKNIYIAKLKPCLGSKPHYKINKTREEGVANVSEAFYECVRVFENNRIHDSNNVVAKNDVLMKFEIFGNDREMKISQNMSIP